MFLRFSVAFAAACLIAALSPAARAPARFSDPYGDPLPLRRRRPPRYDTATL